MKVAFPIKADQGLDSIMDEHFGVAETFIIIDTDTREYTVTGNKKLESGGSSCKTGVISKKEDVDAVVTKCMGDGSQRSLSSKNIQVFQAIKDTVKENLDLLENDELKLFHMFDFCQTKKNKKEGGCGGHH